MAQATILMWPFSNTCIEFHMENDFFRGYKMVTLWIIITKIKYQETLKYFIK